MSRFQFILSAILFLLASPAWSASTVCYLENNILTKSIEWNHRTKAARVTDTLRKTHQGTVTNVRKHGKHGDKTNIYVVYDKPRFGSDAAEFIIFATGPDQYRMIGVGYILRDGKQYLNISLGNSKANCSRQ